MPTPTSPVEFLEELPRLGNLRQGSENAQLRLYADSTRQKLLGWVSEFKALRDAIELSAPQTDTLVKETEAGHDLVVGNLVYYKDATDKYDKALADSDLTLADGIVSKVAVDDYEVAFTGKVTSEAHGFTIGTILYLSGTAAGALTTTRPITSTHWAQRIAKVYDADTLVVQIQVEEKIP